MLKRVIPFAHELLQQSVKPGEFVIDATAGNGYDTVMLASLVGPSGHVFSFDIQKQAVDNTVSRLKEQHLEQATVIHDGHEHLEDYLPEEALFNLGGAIFNLGYLPGSDKQVVTIPETTIAAVESILKHLKEERLCVLVVYHGHPGGEEEKNALLQYLSELDQKTYQVLKYQFINQKNNPPFLLAIEKKKTRS
ncbi:MAG: methyltransferase domain-containing protein [Bacillaceae bacterium]|nr:methyltransferase domain-containing protein [Bacillaceae bacterium]